MPAPPLVSELPWLEPVAAYAAVAHMPAPALLESARPDPAWVGSAISPPTRSSSSPARTAGSRWASAPSRATRSPCSSACCAPSRWSPPRSPAVPERCGRLSRLRSLPPSRAAALARADDMRFPDLVLGFYDVVLAFDHARAARLRSCPSGLPETAPRRRACTGGARGSSCSRRCLARQRRAAPAPVAAGGPVPVQLHPRGLRGGGRAGSIEYILAGDIFQANIVAALPAELPDGLDAARTLPPAAPRNPAPFAALLDFGETAIASASPERFLELARRRGRDPADQGHAPARRHARARTRGSPPSCWRARRTAPRT